MDSTERKIKRCRVLLADDDPDLRELLERALRDAAFEFEIARGGEGALRRFRYAVSEGKRFDMVVLDVSMPDKDGFEVGREIRVQDEDVPIIYLSGIDDPQSAFEAQQVGAIRYLKKPDDLTELRSVIVEILRLEEVCSGNADEN